MFNKFCATITQNKNLLMLLTVAVYILALVGVLYNHLLLISFIVTASLSFLIIRNLVPVKYAVIWALIFYLGVANTSYRLKDTDKLLSLAPVNSEITGKIISIPQGKIEGKPKFFFDVATISFNNETQNLKNEKVLVTINSDSQTQNFEELKRHNKYKLTGRLSAPFKAGNPSQFDYGNYLRNHSTYAVFYAKKFEKINTKLGFAEKAMQWINDYRENILAIHSRYLPSPNLEILGGIVFGDDAVSPPKEIKKSFANSGLLHILAASGMNVAFISGFFYMFMSLFRIDFKIKILLSMFMVIVYTLMTGLGASIIRAAAMLLFVLLGKLIDRDAHSISLLSFVAFLMLIYNPMFINDVGFQLSFIVTFGILIMAPVVARFKNKFLDFLASTVSIPVIAQLWIIPVQIFYFSNISLYSVFANIMSVPILMILSFGGFISSLLSAIKPIADFVCKYFDFILNPLTTILVNISDFWGKLPNSAIQTTHPSITQIILYYLLLLSLTGLLYKEIREKYFKRLAITVCTLLIILLLSIIPIKNSALEIMTFDVGNADCFLIKTPQNEYFMIDTGKAGYNGGKSQAEIIILKYLKDKGIKSLNSLIITHFDNDHCGGAADILKDLKVDSIYLNDLHHKSSAAKSIYKTAEDAGTKIILADNNQVVYKEPDLLIKNFFLKNNDSDNENSILTVLEYRGFKMLFTGDASANSIEALIPDLPKPITILKVPHHGANNVINKNILNELSPEFAIISVGENKFGHPGAHTLALLKEIKVLRTDIHNSLKIKAYKNNFKIYKFDLISKKYKLAK